MNQNEMIQSLRAEIAKLQRVLDLLLDQPTGVDEVRRPGRPKGSGNKAVSFNPEEFAPKKRTMSAEGKARIAEAQKKRWAAQRESFPKRMVRKQAASAKETSKTTPPRSAGKVTPTAKKSAPAGKKPGSTGPASVKGKTAVMDRKTAPKKPIAKKTSKSVTKRPAKQVPQTAPEFQTTA